MSDLSSGPGDTKAEFAAGVIKALPVILATAPFGLLLGAIAAQKGCRFCKSG